MGKCIATDTLAGYPPGGWQSHPAPAKEKVGCSPTAAAASRATKQLRKACSSTAKADCKELLIIMQISENARKREI